MNDVANDILEKDISELFGFEELSDEEKGELLDGIGATVMESAALRFVTESDEKTVAAFEVFMGKHEEDEKMLAELGKSFPRFLEILEEEVSAFKREAVAVLGK